MNPPILNLDDAELKPLPPGFAPTGAAAQRFAPLVARIGQQLGAKKLGYNLTVLPPGKRAYPFHNHRVNEEMFFVVSGNGEIRIGTARYPIRAGDVIACPPGDTSTAHQIVNTSAAELRYLAVSTQLTTEVVEYPDSGKFGVSAEFEVGKDGKPSGFRKLARAGEDVGYWDGE